MGRKIFSKNACTVQKLYLPLRRFKRKAVEKHNQQYSFLDFKLA
jgi:hypothetical protein